MQGSLCRRWLPKFLVCSVLLLVAYPSPSRAALPGGWTSVDVGTPLPGGAGETNGTWTVAGNGNDIWDGAENFHFVYRPVAGDFDVSVRVATLPGGNGWRKAGMMARAALSGNSRNAFAMLSGGNGCRFQYRPADGANTVGPGDAGETIPWYVRLVRVGQTFTGYNSADGVTWVEDGTYTFTGGDVMPDPVFVGMALTSHETAQLITATFDALDGFATIDNADGATDLTMSSATLNGNLFAVDGTTYVLAYFGTTDGITNKTNWDTALSLGVQAVGPLAQSVTGLTPGQTYYYRYYASNAVWEAWAEETAVFRALVSGEWDGDTDDIWGTAANWSNGDVPDTAGENAIFGGTGAGNVSLNGTTYTIGTLDLRGGDYNVTDLSSTPGTLTANALVQSAGDNTLRVGTAITGIADVSGGKLTLASTTNFSASGFNLDGGTLRVVGEAGAGVGYVDGIRGSVFFGTPYDNTPLDLDGAVYSNSFTRVLVGTKAGTLLERTDDANNNVVATGTIEAWNNFPSFDGNADGFCTAFSGRIFPRFTGIHNFRWDNDDAGMMYIDINDDGTFADSEGVVTDPAWGANGNVTLTSGSGGYNFIYMAREGGGGNSLNWWVTEPGQPEVRVSTTVQAGMWKHLATATGPVDMTAIPITVASNSGLEADSGMSVAAMGTLGMNNGVTLATDGSALSFSDVTLPPATTAIGFDTATETYLTDAVGLDGSSAAATVAKTGGSKLILNKPGVNLENATFDVQAGSLTVVATNSLGTADVSLNGGELLLSSAGGDMTYRTERFSVVSDSTLNAAAAGGGVNGPVAVAFGAPGIDINIAAGQILALRTANGYTLSVDGNITNGVGVDAGAGATVPLPFATTNLSDLIVSGGTVVLSNGLTVNDMIVTAGTLTQVGANKDLTVVDNLLLTGHTLDMSDAALNVSNAVVTLTAGSTLIDDVPLVVDSLIVDAASQVQVPQTITASTQFQFDPTVTVTNPLAGNAYVTAGGNRMAEGVVALSPLRGTNAYTGLTHLMRGTLQVTQGEGLPTNSLVVFDGATARDWTAVLQTAGTFSRSIGSAAGEVRWQGMGGGFAARGGSLVVTLEGGSELPWSGPDTGFNNVDSLQFGSQTADGVVDLTNPINLEWGWRRIQVCNNVNTRGDVARISGDITGAGNWWDWLRINENWANDFYDGLLEFTGNNTYPQGTLLDQVVLYAVDGVGLPSASRLEFNGDQWWWTESCLLSQGTFARNVGDQPGDVAWQHNSGGFAARGGDLVVTLEGGVVMNWWDWGQGFNGKVLQLNSQYADSMVELTNPINIGGDERTVALFNNPETDTDVAVLSGHLSGNNHGTYFRIYGPDAAEGGGVLWLRGANDYQQVTLIRGSALRFDSQAVNLSPNTTFTFWEQNEWFPHILEGKGTLDLNVGPFNEVGAVSWEWSHGGFAAYGGPLKVTLEGGANLDVGTMAVGLNQNAWRWLQLGSRTADDVVELVNDMTIFQRDLLVMTFDNPYSKDDYAVLSGNLTYAGTWGNMVVRGDGTVSTAGKANIGELRIYDTSTVRFDGQYAGGQLFTENGQQGTVSGDGEIILSNWLDIRSGGTVAPGAGVGRLKVTINSGDDFQLGDGATYDWELGIGTNDVLEITGNINFQAGWTLRLKSRGGLPRLDREYTLLTYSGNPNGYNDPIIDTSLVSSSWDTSGMQIVHDQLSAPNRIYITGLGTTAGLENVGVTNLTGTSADLLGTLTCSGHVCHAWVYWGNTDGGTEATAWTSNAYLGVYSDPSFEAIGYSLTNLSLHTPYFYAFRATNASIDVWGQPSGEFETLFRPIVQVGIADVGIGTANLNGMFGDQNRGVVTVCWGRTDAGTNSFTDWDHVETIGPQANAHFAAAISGALYGETYYYRCYATNSYGADWSDTAASFRTERQRIRSASGLTVRAFEGRDNDSYLLPITNLFLEAYNSIKTQVDPIDYNSDGNPPHWFDEFPGIGDQNNWALLWDGYFTAEEDATYTFGTQSDDGSALYIDLNGDGRFDENAEYVVQGNLGGHGMQIRTGNATLKAGQYRIAIGWYQGGGGYGMRAKWGKGAGLDFVTQMDFIGGQSGKFRTEPDIQQLGIRCAQPTDVTTDSARLNARLDGLGSVYDVHVYWGDSDQSTNAVLWANNAPVGRFSNVVGTVGYAVSGLTAPTNYYTFFAANEREQMWAVPSTGFVFVTAPTVINGTPAVRTGQADLTGELTAGNFADVYVYWGATDGGMDKSAWDRVELIDTEQGPFAVTVSVGYPETYHFRCYATNVMGDDWAPASTTFAAAAPPLPPGRVYANGLRGSIFWNTPDNITPMDLGDANYENSFTRVFTGDKVGTVLALAEDPALNVVATGPINGWANNWPGFTGGDHFVTALSGRIFPVSTGSYNFHWNNDDAGLTFVDLNDDGIFSSSEQVGDYGWNMNGSVTLTNGIGGYNIIYMAQEYGGGESLWWAYTPPGAGEAVVDPTTQSGVWKHLVAVNPLLDISLTPATDVSSNTVTLNAYMNATGWVFDVYAAWGLIDGGTTLANWDASELVGTFTNQVGPLSHMASGLLPNTSYRYAFLATNPQTNIWTTPSGTLGTLSQPMVANLPPQDVDTGSATLRGQLVAGGAADVTIYWGPVDGGTSPAAWAHTNTFGEVRLNEPFETSVPLLAGQYYFYRCYATNSVGESWASSARSFSSLFQPISIADFGVMEGHTGTVTVVLDVVLAAANVSNVTVNFATADGSATAGIDYAATNGTLTIPGGQLSAQISIDVFGDRIDEYPSETLTVTLNSPQPGAIGDGLAVLSIVDDDLDTTLPDWQYSMRIVFDKYTGTETLTNFPALLVFNEAMFNFRYNQFASHEGADLRFTDATRLKFLNYEIEKWNTDGDSVVWVQLPALAGTNTAIWAYWGNRDFALREISDATEVAGCVLWMKADAVDTNDTVNEVRIEMGDIYVKQWEDQSGNGLTATQANTNDQPLYVANAINGRPVLRFVQRDDNFGDAMQLGDLSSRFPTGATLFVVATINADTRYNLFDNRNNDSRWVAYTWNEARPGAFGDRRSEDVFMPLFRAWPTTGSHIFTMESSSTVYRYLINGFQVGNDPDMQYHRGNGQNWTIGNRPGGGQALNGDIAEFILYDHVLSSDDANRVGQYLERKYALETPYSLTPAPSYATDGSTWSTEHLGVWHMTEPNAEDSTAGKNHGIVVAPEPVVTTAGLVSDAQYFNNSFIRIGNEASFDYYDTLTVSAWVQVESSAWISDWQAFVSKGGEGGQGWQVRRAGNQNVGLFTTRGTGHDDDPVGTIALNDGAWHHVVGVYKYIDDIRSRRYLYVDGQQDAFVNLGGPINPTGWNEWVEIGACDNGIHRHKGMIDEVRIEHTARSADWLRARWMMEGPGQPPFASYGDIKGVRGSTLLIIR